MFGGPGTGIGPALRKARQTRGKSIEEASRDTHIRVEYLHALEREAFGSLKGDVYIRGFLRSYSSYLGLNPDKVVSAYVQAMGGAVDDVPGPPPVVKPTHRPALHKVLHRRGNWALAVSIAVIGLAAAGAPGLLSRGAAAPGTASLPRTPDAAALAGPTVRVEIHARQPLHVTAVVDGQRTFSSTMRKGHTRDFQGAALIRIQLSSGRVAKLTVNGQPLGTPGEKGHPYTASFQPQDFRRGASTPSPGG